MKKIKTIIVDLGGVLVLKDKKTKEGYQKYNRYLLNFLEKIKEKYTLYILTNIDEGLHKLNAERGLYNLFKKVYASCDLGIEKPDKEIFLKIIKDNSLKSEETLFVDDKEEHIDVAKNLRMNTILFKNNKQVSKQLFELGIK